MPFRSRRGSTGALALNGQSVVISNLND